MKAKAHEELDRVLGTPPRLPTFEDRPVLPYIEAIYREVMRWCPQAVAMGVPHATSEDEWYKGYFIPKGALDGFVSPFHILFDSDATFLL